MIALLAGVLGATEVEGFAVADGLAVVGGLAVAFALLTLLAVAAPEPLGCPTVTDAPVAPVADPVAPDPVAADPVAADPVAPLPVLKVSVTTTVFLASVPVLQAVNIRARAAAGAIKRVAVMERRMATTVLNGHPVLRPTRRGARKGHATAPAVAERGPQPAKKGPPPKRFGDGPLSAGAQPFVSCRRYPPAAPAARPAARR